MKSRSILVISYEELERMLELPKGVKLKQFMENDSLREVVKLKLEGDRPLEGIVYSVNEGDEIPMIRIQYFEESKKREVKI